MSIIEINFKCEHCGQEFWYDNFNIAVFLYGVFLLLGKEKEYVGLTCPKCLKTILIKDDSDLVDYTKQNLSSGEHEISFLFYLVRDKDDDPDYSQGTVPFGSKLRYHSSVRYNLEKNAKLKDFDIPASFMQLTNDFENELNMVIEEHPELQEQFLCPYMESGKPSMGPYLSVWWFREDQIDDLVKIENDEELRIFPRYIHKIFEIEYIDRFCWDYYLPEEQLHRDKTRLPYDFVDILTAEPSPIELPISHLSSYEFLWKTPHPFEDKGVPRSLLDIDPVQFQKPKKTFEFDKIAGETRDYFETGYGLNFIDENYETFIKKYIDLAQSSSFSYALVWELKEKYLKLLHGQMHKEALSKSQYAFYSEGPTWTITFDGKTLRGLKGKGFEYLHHLVCNKNKRIYPSELVQLGSTPKNDFNEPNKQNNLPVDFEDDGEKRDSDFDRIIKRDLPIEKADDRFLEDLKKERARLRKEVKEATENNDLDRKEKAIMELKKFSWHLKEYLGKKDKIRIYKDGSKKTKDRIAVNINRALERIKKDDFTAWNHFKKALGSLYSEKLSYRPSKDIDWHT